MNRTPLKLNHDTPLTDFHTKKIPGVIPRQDRHGATVGAKVSVEAMTDADMSAVVHEDPSDAAIDGEHMDAVGHPDENQGPNAKEDVPASQNTVKAE
ncbi:hypothetical protein Tco_1290886, partial [Tanacetum coccineum]